MRKLYHTLFWLTISIQVFALNQNDLDSLTRLLSGECADTVRIKTLLDIGFYYESVDLDSSLYYYDQARQISVKISNYELEARSDLWTGIVWRSLGNYPKSIDYYRRALNVYNRIGNTLGASTCLMNIGNVHYTQSNYDSALDYHFQSMEIKLKSIEKDGEKGDRRGLAYSYNNIGLIYSEKGSYDLAVEFYLKGLKLNEEIDDPYGTAGSCTNIGSVYEDQKSYDLALEYHHKALKIYEELEYTKGLSMCYNNIGLIHKELGDYEKALDFQLKALKIKEKQADKFGLSNAYLNIGSLYQEQCVAALSETKRLALYDSTLSHYSRALAISLELDDKYTTSLVYGNMASLNISFSGFLKKSQERNNMLEKAVEYATLSLKIGEEIKSLIRIYSAAWYLKNANLLLGKYEKALEYAELYISVKDSVFSEEKTKALAEMTTRYETEKKQLQIEKMDQQKQLDNKTIEAQQAENRKQQIIIISAVGGFFIVLIFSIIILRMFRQKKRANLLLARKNEEISQQKEEITSQRDEIEAQRDKLSITLTELRETQDQLVESEKMASLGNLVMGMAHEMNTPLGVGITASSTLEEITKEFAGLYKSGNMTRQQLEEFLNHVYDSSKLIRSNLDRTGKLVQTFKMISTDEQSADKLPVNISTFAEDFMQSMKRDFESRSITYSINSREELVINSFPEIWGSILHNLVSNSLKHGFQTTASPHISIEIKEERDFLIFVYTDNGRGIAADDLSRIFDPFFTSNKQLGPGLGLSIVYNMVTQRLNGQISCDSTIDQFTRFTVKMPVENQ